MGLMAGMLPGVESARRRRLRPAGSSAEAPCGGTRRPSALCLYAASNGHEHHAHLGSAAFPKQRNEDAWTTTLDSNAREAKERLDQKLRSQRESVVKRRHSTGSLRLPATSTASDHRPAKETAAAARSALQREVFPKKADGRRFLWGRRRRHQQEEEEEECAVCLEDLRAGDLLARLPCAHRFHWPCAAQWVRAASRCPVCRAAVPLAAGP